MPRRPTAAGRVAIVDFDVHHGNGTLQIFWDDKTVMHASAHEMPHNPHTGARGERGEHDQIVNGPLRAADGGEAFREAMEVAILPRIEVTRLRRETMCSRRMSACRSLRLFDAEVATDPDLLFRLGVAHRVLV
jgi:acetoin utilization deacetylase AcuC-like enzyme